MIVKELPQGCDSCFCSYVDYCYEEYVLWCGALDECVTGNQYDRPNNCPLKSIDGLIEKINEQEFTHHNGDNHWYMTPAEIKEIVGNIIREYCEVEE